MFKTANRKHKTDLRGTLHRRTARGKKLYLDRKRLEFKKICERSEVYKKAIREWANYEPWWSKQNKDFGWWDGPILATKEPFILSFRDNVSIKVTTIAVFLLTLLFVGTLLASTGTRDLVSNDGAVAFVFGTFILVNGAVMKFLYFVIRKPCFEEAKKKFKDEHPYLAYELWPEKAGET